jgi:hypothetical protein
MKKARILIPGFSINEHQFLITLKVSENLSI